MKKRGANAVGPSSMSKSALGKLSEIRRGEIRNAANNEMNELEAKEVSRPTASVVRSSSFVKTAMPGPVTLPSTSGQTANLGPEVYSPLFQLANLNLPRDRVTMNAWCRVFYDTHPIVRNAINLHASYPISKINITCQDKRIQDFFLEMAENIDLYSVVYGLAIEFWKLGEVFPYAELDRENRVWKRITILNPDFINVSSAVIGNSSIISMVPDAGLKRLVASSSPTDMSLKKKIPQYIIDLIKKGHNIPLDKFNISHLKLLSSPYDSRGTSIIVSIFKDLMLYDKIREAKLAQADGMINPLTLVKLGDGADYRPTQSELEEFRQVMEEAQFDKDFKLVTHSGVTIERLGFSGATLEVGTDLDLINQNIYTGLMVPKSLMDQEGASYASSSVGLEVLRQRYDIFRNMVKKWLEQKIFAPICEMNDFFKYENGQKKLVVPVVDFNHMNLYDIDSYISAIGNYVSNKQISLQTLYRSLGLNKEEEGRRLREEAIENAIREKEIEILSKLRLSELHNLDPDKAIVEPPEETPQTDLGGGDIGMSDMSGGDMGGDAGGAPPPLPGMETPPL